VKRWKNGKKTRKIMLPWTKISLTDIRQGAQILGTKTAVFYLLKMYAGKSEDQKAYPAQQTLADIAGVSKDSVSKALKQLQEAGWIKRVGYTDNIKRTAIWIICDESERVCKILQGGVVKSYKGGLPNITNKKEKEERKKKNNKNNNTNFSNSEPEIRIRIVPEL